MFWHVCIYLISLQYGEPYQTVAERSNGDDQWNRLYRAETLSSKRREVLYFDPQVRFQ